jgi:hypothetical protein
VKTITAIALVPSFSLFLGLALATQGQAEEHYIYKDPDGKLVISNKTPPPGSSVLKKQDLPEATEPQVQQRQESGDTPLNGHSEVSGKPSRDK